LLRPNRAIFRLGAGLRLLAVLLLGAAGLMAPAMARGEGPAPQEAREIQAGQPGETGSAAEVTGESRTVDDRLRPSSRLLLPRNASSAGRAYGSDAWYLALASVAVVLAAAGGLAVAARRFNPRPGAGALHVVSRVSLSPKHTVYLLRAGGRVLLVGTGPQGAPALISELDDISAIAPAGGQGEAS
jgi:hypothetical protein